MLTSSRLVALLAVATSIHVTTAEYVTGKAFDRFITIWLENQDFTKVDANSDILDLTKEGILLTEYYGLTHPSQPNYLASVAGDYFGLNHDGFVRIPENVSTVVDLFDTKNIEWKGYFEGSPGPGYMGEGSASSADGKWNYVRKHNPFVSFDSVNHNGTRLRNLLSFTDFEHDVAQNSLPQYAHMSPDMLNDGHNTSLSYAANWTSSFLKPLLANKYFMNNTLILLTYDESETYSIPNKIVSVLLGGAVPKALQGTTDSTFYTHYSILSTLQSNWELPSLGRYDVGANVFSLVAQQTGWVNHPPSNLASINNSLSYGGYLNSDPKKNMSIPVPNLWLNGPGGLVDEEIMGAWAAMDKVPNPYDGSGVVYDGGNGIENDNAPVYKVPVANNITTTTPSIPSATSAPASTTSLSAGARLRGFRLLGLLGILWFTLA